MADAGETQAVPAAAMGAQVVPAALTALMTAASKAPSASSSAALAEKTVPPKLPAGGTVVLDVEEGGIEVPSFLGKNLRGAVEAAQDAGLDLDAIGSGVAGEQSPLPGARVAAGARVTVKFGR